MKSYDYIELIIKRGASALLGFGCGSSPTSKVCAYPLKDKFPYHGTAVQYADALFPVVSGPAVDGLHGFTPLNNDNLYAYLQYILQYSHGSTKYAKCAA